MGGHRPPLQANSNASIARVPGPVRKNLGNAVASDNLAMTEFPPHMHPIFASFFSAVLFTTAASHGGTVVMEKETNPCPPDPLLVLDFGSSYVFESDFERGNDASGDAWATNFRLGYRIPFDGPAWGGMECSQWYVRLGVEYRRYDFNNSGGLPIPNTLQSASAIFAIEYLVYGRPAVYFEALPGLNFEHDIDADTFDVPVRIASAFKIVDNVYAVVGANYAGLRKYPILPIAGVQWRINDAWTLSLIPPDPRITYNPVPEWEFWAGGELTGGAFRTDSREVERNENLSNAVVSYSEYRAGLGFTFTKPGWRVEVAAGYAFQREFDYHRAEEKFETDEGAPFVRAELRLNF
jgi:hypothetical protein